MTLSFYVVTVLPSVAKERLFKTHASRPGDTYVETPEGFRCESCETVMAEEHEIKAHVYEGHGPGPGPLPTDHYVRDLALPESELRYRCRLCWHATPGFKLMLFHLRRHHAITPLPWETSSSLSCKYYDVLGSG